MSSYTKSIYNLRKRTGNVYYSSEHIYHDIFVTEYNIHFAYPGTNICNTCDNLMFQIEAASSDEKSFLQETLETHQKFLGMTEN